MSETRDHNYSELRKMSRRKAGRFIVNSILKALDMCPAEVARLTSCSPDTVSRYAAGKRVPKAIFLLDLLDKAPNAGFTFDRIAAVLGHPWNGSLDPAKYRSFAYYASAVRVLAARNRDQFAIKLDVAVEDVYAVEHGFIPSREFLLSLVRNYLRPHVTARQLIRAFAVLHPSEEEIAIREQLLKLRELDDRDPMRKGLEHDLIVRYAPTARQMAERAAWRVRDPKCAEELWGEGLVLAIRNHRSEKGLFFPYLRRTIGGLAGALKRQRLQSGVRAALSNYGTPVRDAEERLWHELRRSPTDHEIAEYLDVPVYVVTDTRQALNASQPVFAEDLEFLLHQAVEIRSFSEPTVPSDHERICDRLKSLPEDQSELLLLHYGSCWSVEEIARHFSLAEEVVLECLKAGVEQLQAFRPR